MKTKVKHSELPWEADYYPGKHKILGRNFESGEYTLTAREGIAFDIIMGQYNRKEKEMKRNKIEKLINKAKEANEDYVDTYPIELADTNEFQLEFNFLIESAKKEHDDLRNLLAFISTRLDIEKMEKGGNYFLSAIHDEIKSFLT